MQLVLLSAFIAATSNSHHLLANSTDLPKVAHAIAMRAANREDALVVAVERDGRIWLGDERPSVEELPSRIRESISYGAERKVYIRADSRLRYSDVLQVLQSVRSAGVEHVAFLTYERNTTRDPKILSYK